MHLDIGLSRDVGARENWNRQAVSELFVKFVEVEISHLESEVAKTP